MAKQRKRKKWLKRLGIIALLFLIIGYVLIDHVAPYMIIVPQRRIAAELPAHYPNGSLPADYGLTAEKHAILTRDSITLQGYYFDTDSSRGTMILLHGIGAHKEQWFGLTQKLLKRNVSVFIFDGRAHGESGGDYCTYGYYEKYDVADIITTLESLHPAPHYGVWGNSLGGAIALQATAVDHRIDLTIVESTFANLRDVVYDYKKRMIGIGIRWISDRVLARAGKIADFDPAEVVPSEVVKSIETPVFMSHGDADKNINIAYGRLNFEHLASEQKQFYTVEGAGHNGVMHHGGKVYEDALFGFLDGVW